MRIAPTVFPFAAAILAACSSEPAEAPAAPEAEPQAAAPEADSDHPAAAPIDETTAAALTDAVGRELADGVIEAFGGEMASIEVEHLGGGRYDGIVEVALSDGGSRRYSCQAEVAPGSTAERVIYNLQVCNMAFD